MKVFLERKGIVDIKFNGKTVGDLLKQLGLNPQEVVVVKDGDIVLSDETVDDLNEIKILSVISGG